MIDKNKTKLIAFFAITILFIAGIGAFLYYQSYDKGTHYHFKNINQAEKKIGFIQTPQIPKGYSTTKVIYNNDGFTAPTTSVYYKNNRNHEIEFMVTGTSLFEQAPFISVHDAKIKEMYWIQADNEYILKWRKSNKASYKYLISKDRKDQNKLMKIADRGLTSNEKK